MGTLIRWSVVLLVALTATAQVQENVTVELIEVPVYVTGPDGQPIRGLTKDSFELRVNRKPQPIEYFDAIDFGAPHPQQAEAARPQRERRLYLLMFDKLYSIPGMLARAQRAAEDVVAQSDPQTDFFAVATYTANKGVQFVAPFLSDRVAVRRAIATLAVSKSGDPLRVGISPTERVEWIAPDEAALTGGGRHGEDAGQDLDDMLHGGAAMHEMQVQQQRNGAEDLLENFGALAARLSAMEGQKHVVYFSLGFQSSLVHGGDNPVPAGVTGSGGTDARTSRLLDDMFKAFRSSGVFLDTVDIAGVRASQGGLGELDNDALQFMAHGTGGDFVHNQNNLAAGLNEMTNAQKVVYVLAFNRSDRRAGSIDVRVRNLPHGSTVSFRQGFGAAEQKSVDPLELADIMVNDIPQNSFDLHFAGSKGEFTIEVPHDEIVQLGGKAAAVELLLYIYDANGSVIFARGRTLTTSEPMIVHAAVRLAPGKYVAKALARLRGTNLLAFKRTEINVVTP